MIIQSKINEDLMFITKYSGQKITVVAFQNKKFSFERFCNL